jgi:hypothetical protein
MSVWSRITSRISSVFKTGEVKIEIVNTFLAADLVIGTIV